MSKTPNCRGKSVKRGVMPCGLFRFTIPFNVFTKRRYVQNLMRISHKLLPLTCLTVTYLPIHTHICIYTNLNKFNYGLRGTQYEFLKWSRAFLLHEVYGNSSTFPMEKKTNRYFTVTLQPVRNNHVT